MQDLLASYEGNPLTATLCGYAFEPYAIELLERGGTFTCQQLVHRNTKIQPIEATLIILLSKTIVVDSVYATRLSISFMCQKQKTIQQSMPGFLELAHFK
jgi:hypothetical protein